MENNTEDNTIELAIGQIWKSYAGRRPEFMNKEIKITYISDDEIEYQYLHDDTISYCYRDSFDHYFEYVREYMAENNKKYYVIISRFRGMGDFKSTFIYSEEDADKLVDELREAFESANFTMSAHREEVK